MQASQLRTVVLRLVSTSTSDASGGQNVSWSTSWRTFGYLRPVGGASERVAAGVIQSPGQWLLTLRGLMPLALTDRVVRVQDGKQFEIVGLREQDGRSEWLEVDVTEATQIVEFA